MCQADRSDRYVLPRNDVERERLERQHILITKALGGRLILDEGVTLGPVSRVLDSATGAASWILDLVKSTEGNFEAVGNDLSSAMFPENVPSNVKLYEYSVFDLPKEWVNTFDLVNQRLLLAAFTESQWLVALSELYRVLKPGGTIQLVEVGQLEQPHDWSLLPAQKKAGDIYAAVYKKRGVIGWDIGRRLPEMLEKVGFSPIRVEDYHAPLGKSWGELGREFSENRAAVGRIVGAICVQEGLGVVQSLAEVDAIMEEAEEELGKYPGIYFHLDVLIATKPKPTA